MTTDLKMPALSPTMEEGSLVKWLKEDGDSVVAGEPIAEIETDKAVMEVEALDDGALRILVPAGTENIKVNQVIAKIEAEGTAAGPLVDPPSPPAAPSTGTNPFMVEGAAARPLSSGPADEGIPEGTTFSEVTVREALRDAMAEEMRRNPDVFVMGEEVGEYQGAYKVTQGLLEEFGPDRVYDTPITEHGFAGVGVGAAMAGLHPIVEFMTWNFAMQATDQIVNSAAKTRYMSGGQVSVPIVFRGPNGAASRLAAQHSQDFSAWYASIPGLKVVAPYTAADAKGLLKAAIRDPNPVIFLENELLYGRKFPVPEIDDWTVPLGRARTARKGGDVTIVSFGIAMTHVEAAVGELFGDGISAEVIDLRTLQPLDIATVAASVRKTHRCVTVEQGWSFGSIGSEIAAQLQEQIFDWLDAPIARVNGKDVPMPYAANLERLALPSAAEIVEAVRAVCYRG